MLFARKRPRCPFVFLRSCLCYCFFQLSASRPAPCCSLRLLSLLPIHSFHLTTLDPCRAHEASRPGLLDPRGEVRRHAFLTGFSSKRGVPFALTIGFQTVASNASTVHCPVPLQ